MDEASCWDRNCFVTLTYSNEFLPKDLSLRYRDFQLFLKRLRWRDTLANIRFFMSGEYGERFSRPHYHACLFNYDLEDRTYWTKSDAGAKVFKSETLDRIWGLGRSYVGDLTFESAAYVARYCLDKWTGDGDDKKMEIIDPDTGEVRTRVKEFSHMSLKPGIGALWLKKFRSDVYPHGTKVVNGAEARPPRYYDKMYEKWSPTGWAKLQEAREIEGRKYAPENLPGRIEPREEVAAARMRDFKRSLIGD